MLLCGRKGSRKEGPRGGGESLGVMKETGEPRGSKKAFFSW
jgi:hypothetical protein